MDTPEEVVVRTARRLDVAEEWALVLVAEGLAATVERGPEGFALLVPEAESERAIGALSAYERENPLRAPLPPERRIRPLHMRTALSVSAAMIAFFLATGPRNPAVDWFAQGSADAARILDGELWRTVTALTLHANLGHVLGNAAAGALFLSAVFASLGPGLGAALAVLAGASGNLANAIFQHPEHVSVGASTSVFGAVGVLAGLGVVRGRRRGASRRRAWAPVAAGLALLCFSEVSRPLRRRSC